MHARGNSHVFNHAHTVGIDFSKGAAGLSEMVDGAKTLGQDSIQRTSPFQTCRNENGRKVIESALH